LVNLRKEYEKIEARMFETENGKALRKVLPDMKENIFLAIFLELKKKSKEEAKKPLLLKRR